MKKQTIYKHNPNTNSLSVQCCFEPSAELKALLRYLHKDDAIEGLWKTRYASELRNLRQPIGTWTFQLPNCGRVSIIEIAKQDDLKKCLKLSAAQLLLPIFKRVKEKEHQAFNAWEKEYKKFKEETARAKKEQRTVSLIPPKKPKQHRLPNLTHFKQLYFKRFFSEGVSILSGPPFFDDLYQQLQSNFPPYCISYIPHVKVPFLATELETMYFQTKGQRLSQTQRDKFDTLLRYFILHIDKHTYACTKVQRQIALETGIAKSTVSRFIDMLVAAKKVIRHPVPKTSTRLLIAADDMFDAQEDVPRPTSKNYSFIEASIQESKHLEKLYYQAICHSQLPHIRRLAIKEYTIFKMT
ncbi:MULTISPECIES: hypothetical protein [Vibrio harveyi group]|uniref:hypothetical protein n=1 Tax=Vibrio harveyi group TaxID=717610 RepID=UPI000CE4B212|nr:hypothetical protein [Vibrio jasicida]